MTTVSEFRQPSVQELHAFYKGMDRRQKEAETRNRDSCLIAAQIKGTHDFFGVAVSPDEYSLTLYTSEDEWEDFELDGTLTRLADYFDRYDRDGNQRPVSAAACVRIIERFAKKEGIAL